MKQCYTLLKKMEDRPAMWTGEATLKSIRTFLDGYYLALHENNLVDEGEEVEPNFHDWIANKLGFGESTAGWHHMILAYTIGLNPKKIQWKDYDVKVSKEQHKESIKQFYIINERHVSC